MVCVYLESSKLSYGEVLDRWENDKAFRLFFVELLRDSPYRAFRWETPPLTEQSLSSPFEFVLLNSPDLDDRQPDIQTFAELFKEIGPGGVGELQNLGGDALLVVPAPIDKTSAYTHIGSYLRSAPESQLHNLWRAIGSAVKRRIREQPIWLSTAGGGVAWLHVRLDDRPKYYGYRPYRDFI